MAPPQPRKGPVRVPQNPLMGGFLGSQMPTMQGAFSPPQSPSVNMGQYGPVTAPSMQAGMLMPFSPAGGILSAVGRANTAISNPLVLGIQRNMERGQQANAFTGPPAPASPLSPSAQSQMDFMQRQEEARQQNTRYGDMTQPAGQAYSNGLSLRPEDIRSRLANREGAMQPGGAQMQRRFAPESPLGQQAAEYQRGLTGVDRGEGVFIQEGGRGSNQSYLQFNNTPGGAAEVAAEKARLRREDPSAPGYRSPEERAALLQKGRDRRQAAIDAGIPKQRAEAKRQSLQDRTLKRAVMKGLNPLSPQAQALYPEAVGRLRAARAGGGQQAPASPLNPANPFASGPGGSVTPDDRANAKATARALVQGVPGPPDKDGNPTPGTAGNPFLQQMGISGDLDAEQNIGAVHQGMVANLESDTPVTPTVQDLRKLHGYMQAMQSQHGEKSGKLEQTFIKSPPIAMFQHRWDELAKMPANASDKEFEDWYARFAGTSRTGMSIF